MLHSNQIRIIRLLATYIHPHSNCLMDVSLLQYKIEKRNPAFRDARKCWIHIMRWTVSCLPRTYVQTDLNDYLNGSVRTSAAGN